MFPKGFKALGVHAGIYADARKKDLAVFYSDLPATAAAVFTRSELKSESLLLSRKHMHAPYIQAIVANAGCANTCTGARGYADARGMALAAAAGLHIPHGRVLVASTGVIGSSLPGQRVRRGIRRLTGELYLRNKSQPLSAAEAIMTTDTVRKVVQRRFKITNRWVRLWECAKGSGMIHPTMATMLAFILTDAALPRSLLGTALRQAVAGSFNCLSIDGEMSPNDTVFVLANGGSGIQCARAAAPGFRLFQEHLDSLCADLARRIAEDGEGARKTIEFRIHGAPTTSAARRLAANLATSPLVKTAIAGSDPNWGRIMAVIGRSFLRINPRRIAIAMNGIEIVSKGMGVRQAVRAATAALGRKSIVIDIALHAGSARARYLTCDLTELYVRINSHLLT